MLYPVFKAALPGVIVAIVSDVAKRWPGLGGELRPDYRALRCEPLGRGATGKVNRWTMI